jgi:hypothetical protein
MAIDYEALARAGGLSKGTPIRTQQEKAKAAWQTIDKRESAKVRKRSGGQCEVRAGNVRCLKRAGEVHHHLGGFGVRGRGDSAKARNKTHACSGCHGLITSRRLQHIQGNHYRVR